jgi:prepilin signal peptidase PulO-like enzyme (type II secretory pathway)
METFLPVATFGFALGWPLELVIQRFPKPEGTSPSARRRWIVCIVTAVLFAALALQIGINAELAPALLLTALIVPASAIDLRYRIIPDAINLPGAVAVLVLAVIAQPDRWLEFLLGGLLGAFFLFVPSIISRGGMGMGDVKMMLMIGFCLGQYVLVALFFGFLLSLIPSFAMFVTKGWKARKITFPFGPFLAAGAMIALLWGPQLWSLWLTGQW